jgi:hypothetical protein
MKTVVAKAPFGKAMFEPIRSVRFLESERQYEVEFESGAVGILTDAELRRANRLPPTADPVDSIWIDGETRSGFFVRYVDRSTAEASWELVLENPPT